MNTFPLLLAATATLMLSACASDPREETEQAAVEATVPDTASDVDEHAGHVMDETATAVDPHAGHAMPGASAADPHAAHTAPAARTGDPHAAHAAPAAAQPRAEHDHAAPAEPAGVPPAHAHHEGHEQLMELARTLLADPAVQRRIAANAELRTLWSDQGVREHFLGDGAPDRAADSAAVVAVVDRYHQALSAGDSSTALALLAPDAVILESGGIETRDEYRSHHLPSDIEFARTVPSVRGPVLVTVQGNVAWASSTSTSQGEFRGRPVNAANAELMVLVRTQQGWRISAIHWSSRSRRQ